MEEPIKKIVRRPFSFFITVLAGASVGHMVHQLKNHSLDIRYFGRVALTVVVGVILEPFRWWENIYWRNKIKKVNITKPPVFIIGFWRSGTTMLHNLLCVAPGSVYITTYQTVFPDLLLSHSWWFKPIIGKFWPTHRPFDDLKMGLDLPQEEEIALANLQTVSFYNFLYFPKDFEKFYEKELLMENVAPDLVKKWKAEYIRMIRKAFINLKGERFISKSPSNMARVKLILEMFPDAKFIFLYREPYKSVESFYRFFHEVLPAVQVQAANDSLNRERLTGVYADLIHRYLAEKEMINPVNLMEIKFEEFSKDPLEGLRIIYERFGLEDFNKALPYFKAYLDEVAEFRQTKYEVTQETIKGVNKNAGDIIEWLGYPHKT